MSKNDLLSPRLAALRDELHRRGQRRSMVFPSASPNVVEAVAIVEEFGALCEAMFLVMASERKVLNVQRQLLRGALDVLSDGRVRTAHMEAMLDAASKQLAADGHEKRCRKVIEALREDPIHAETTIVLAAAVAAADGRISENEQALLDRFAKELDVDQGRLSGILRDLVAETTAKGSVPSA